MFSPLNAFRSSPLRQTIEILDLTVVDIGARGGIDEDCLPIAWATNGIGFEPETAECDRLNEAPADPWKSLRFIPVAVGSDHGGATLFVPEDPAGASLRRHNEDMVEEFGYAALHRSIRELLVETTTLDAALAGAGVSRIDYLKVDVEGVETELLRASPRSMSCLSALKAEGSFLEQRVGQTLAWDLASWICAQGFVLAEIRDLHSWRSSPLPCHPFVPGRGTGYSRGRPAQCDLVFLRRLDRVSSQEAIRVSMTAAALGHFDYALRVLGKFPAEAAALSESCGVACDVALKELSRRIGRLQARRALAAHLRAAVPLARSAFGWGVPVPRAGIR